MKLSLISALCLGFSLTIATQAGHAAAISNATNTKVALPTEKTSLIEKAIHQQKTESKLQSDDNLKVLTSLKVAPTQNFFASQNQSFTRFIQALFLPNNS